MRAVAKRGCRRACRRGRRVSFGVVVRGRRWCGGEQRCSARGRGEVARGWREARRRAEVQRAGSRHAGGGVEIVRARAEKRAGGAGKRHI